MAYIGTSTSNAIRRRFIYEATASQTSFSGSDENGVTLTYVDSLYLDVFQNGVKLKAGDDYTATTGTTVVLATGASANDVVEMIAFDVFSVNDSVSASAGGNFGGNVAMAGTLAVTGVPTFTGRSVHSGGITVANDGQIGSVGDADAMAISSSGVVTFSQTPVGAGSLTLLLDSEFSTAVANFDISATYITSAYDTYILQGNLLPATDNQQLNMRVFVGGSVLTAADYDYENTSVGATSPANDDEHTTIVITDEGVGNAAGEHVTIDFTLQNINNTAVPFSMTGITNQKNSNSYGGGTVATGGLMIAHRADVVNGIRLYFSSGNVASGTIRLYGVST